MEITNSLSEQITSVIQDGYHFFANQSMSTYAIILAYVAMATFAICYVLKLLNMIKISYKDVDHVGFRKINFLILIAVILFSQVGAVQSLVLNIFFGIFIIPLLSWFIFMIKLFILNIKQYQQKKNFVKNKKKQAEIGKQLGVTHRVSRNNLGGEYTTAEDMYKDYVQDKPEVEEVCPDVFRRRISAESLQERRTTNEE